jgi:hypothetical protein
MSKLKASAPHWPVRVVCDGQSILNTIPWQLHRALDVPVDNVAQNGLSITVLHEAGHLALLESKLLPTSALNIWLFCGGNSDLSEEDSGQEIYDQLIAYKADVFALGDDDLHYDLSIVTTITPNRFSPILGHEDERLDFNELLLANTAGFDAVVDLEVGIMADPESVAYQRIDGTHPTAVGANFAAYTLIAPVLDTLLP